MVLMSFVGAQAILGLLFFSPSAAAPCRGTPDPTLGFPGRPAGRPGTQPGPDPGPVLLGDVPGFLRSMFAWTGPGRDSARHRARSRAGPGPEPARTAGVSTTCRGGGCGASRLRDAGLRPHCSHPLGSFCCCVCLAWCVCCCSCAGPRSRPGEGALPRRLRAALWEPCGATRLWLRRAPAPLFFAPSSALARAGPGPPASSPAGAAGRE